MKLMIYQENKIVIFDWGGIVESHREGEYNCNQVTINIIKKLNPNIKENEIIEKWKECSCDENGRNIGTYKDIENVEEWYKRIKNKFDLTCNFRAFIEIYRKEYAKIYFYKDVVELEHKTKQKCKIGIFSNLTLLDKERERYVVKVDMRLCSKKMGKWPIFWSRYLEGQNIIITFAFQKSGQMTSFLE